ncbi:MAG: (Fe-S)-binding protein [Planctomycetales bacterium]|nr:(Fe-S)-binding protein [Planctomycetales bacterium]
MALFVPCFVGIAAPRVAAAARRVLERLGCDVTVPPGQTCCGQPAFSVGARAEARDVAARWTEVFAGAEWVVAPSGSCVGMVRKHYETLGVRADVVPRTRELAEFLVEVLGVTRVPGAKLPGPAGFHGACHLLRDLRNAGPARTLLRNVEGAELRDLDTEEWCCGFGGLFSVAHPELSCRMAEWKLRDAAGEELPVVPPGPARPPAVRWLVSPEASCLLQLQGVAGRAGLPVRVVHLAEVLAGDLS